MSSTQLKFRLGYAPGERYALKEHLGSHGIPTEDMVEAGLLIAGDDIPVPFDRFRDRVMFPITDLRGRVIAFGGRALEKDAQAKYLNSPETPLFHKGATLYNIAAARQAAHDGAQLIVVEGYVDVIAMVSAGFPATVAPLGTALTEDQLGLLWKMADEPLLCFDGDNAGVRAAYRAVDLAMPRLLPGKSLKFALLPQGQDPDDLFRSGGREAIAEVIAAARPLAADAVGARDRRPSVRHAGAARRARSAPQRGHRDDRRRGRAQILPAGFQRAAVAVLRAGAGRAPRVAQPGAAARAGAGAGNWRERGERRDAPQRFALTSRSASGKPAPYVVVSNQMASSSVMRGPRSTVPLREALILQAALNHPWLLHDHLEELASLEFRHAEAEKLKGALIDIAAHSAHTRPTLDRRRSRPSSPAAAWPRRPRASPPRSPPPRSGGRGRTPHRTMFW